MGDSGMTPAPRARLNQGCIIALGVVAAMALAVVATLWAANRWIEGKLSPVDPVTVASASLEGLREQNRLSAFAARYVAVVTSKQSRLGLSAEKTLIMPGLVRYEVDLGRLQQRDVRWDAATKRLTIRLPAIELVGPQVDLSAIREYGGTGILTTLTDAEKTLDTANRRAGQDELVKQARAPVPMKLARDATRRAVERSFAMPLRAAGLDATVEAFFADEDPNAIRERWDQSRSVEEVLKDRR